MILKEWIQKNLFNSIGNLNQRKINSLEKTNLEKFLEISEKSKQFKLSNIRETLYWILNDITEYPVCLKCGNRLKYYNIHDGYPKFCSSKCSNSSDETKKNKEKTFKRKYGSTSPFQIPEVLERTKAKHLEHYGVDNPFQAEEVKEKMRETFKKNYGVEWSSLSKEIREKQEETNLERYGSRKIFGSKEIQEKIKQTNLENLGVEYPTQSHEVIETRKQNNLQKYGISNIFQFTEIQKKIKETNLKRYGVIYPQQSAKIKTKVENTMNEKYGCWYSKTEQYRETIKEKQPEIQRKSYETKKKNNSFNKSKVEDRIYLQLIGKFPDTIRQHKSINYPWVCDFYIPSKDLYIEYLGTWTHGNKPYDSTDPECIELVEKMKRKSEELNFKGEKKKFYLNAIATWTKFDVTKRTHAKETNLNYLEFFNEAQFNEWFSASL